MTEVSVHLIYLLGLVGYSLLMTGLFLSTYVANCKEKSDHDLATSHLREQIKHFTALAKARKIYLAKLSSAQARTELDLATSHQLITQAFATLDERDTQLAQAKNDLDALKNYLRTSHPDAFADAQVVLAWQNSEHAFLNEGQPQEATHA